MTTFNWNVLFDFILGWASFLSFGGFIFCVASLRSYVDEEKVRKEENISSLFKGSLPPERVLTDIGKKRAKNAKILLIVAVSLFAVIVCIWNFPRFLREIRTEAVPAKRTDKWGYLFILVFVVAVLVAANWSIGHN